MHVLKQCMHSRALMLWALARGALWNQHATSDICVCVWAGGVLGGLLVRDDRVVLVP